MNTRDIFSKKIHPINYKVQKDEHGIPRPEHHSHAEQRGRMAFYLQRIGYKQLIPSTVPNAFHFVLQENIHDGWVDTSGEIFMTKEGVTFLTKEQSDWYDKKVGYIYKSPLSGIFVIGEDVK